MSLLDQIVSDKHKEVEARKKLDPISELENRLGPLEKVRSLREKLLHGKSSGIIAEIKKKSPSKGIINPNIIVPDVAKGYQQAGAAAISVLTDEKYFSGRDQDLKEARAVVSIPILRKDFIIDEYQILEAKLMGADLILLIARILSKKRIEELTLYAKKLGLEVLLEVHSEKELHESLNDDVDLVGVNNRDLDTLKIDTILSFNLADKIPKCFVKISESGISSPDTVKRLQDVGYDGFLMGENFMKENDPSEACKSFIDSLHSINPLVLKTS